MNISYAQAHPVLPTFEISSMWGANNVDMETTDGFYLGERDFIFISKELADYYDIYIKSNSYNAAVNIYAADYQGWDFSKVSNGYTYQFINNSGSYAHPMTTADYTKIDVDWHSTINGSKFSNCSYLWFYSQCQQGYSSCFILRFVPKN